MMLRMSMNRLCDSFKWRDTELRAKILDERYEFTNIGMEVLKASAYNSRIKSRTPWACESKSNWSKNGLYILHEEAFHLRFLLWQPDLRMNHIHGANDSVGV